MEAEINNFLKIITISQYNLPSRNLTNKYLNLALNLLKFFVLDLNIDKYVKNNNIPIPNINIVNVPIRLINYFTKWK